MLKMIREKEQLKAEDTSMFTLACCSKHYQMHIHIFFAFQLAAASTSTHVAHIGTGLLDGMVVCYWA